MDLQIERADFADPRLAAFLQAHLDELQSTVPPESRHALDLDGLQRPGVRMWVARSGGHLVGTSALAELEPEHEELKSMRTDPLRRGHGIASALLSHLVADARGRGIRRISLETGSMEFFVPARALYAKAGFVACARFGAYLDDPNKAFMTLAL